MLEAKWIQSFQRVFELSKIQAGDEVIILSESQSSALNVQLAELALGLMSAKPMHLKLISPPQTAPVPVRSTGASQAIQGLKAAMAALTSVPVIIDLTVEGLMHAVELPQILNSGTRVINISNEHPEILERLVPTLEDKVQTLSASKAARSASTMLVQSKAGTDLRVDMSGAATVGIWGFTDKPGTLAHWPGGLVVSFPKKESVNGTLLLAKGDINLTFKRYLESDLVLTIENDYITAIEGEGTDLELMERYLAAWNEPEAYAVSHVGFGLNERARYEALSMYDKAQLNGTELRAFAGNFLFSTGANEFAGRFSQGHFDIPVRNCDIYLDSTKIIEAGKLLAFKQ